MLSLLSLNCRSLNNVFSFEVSVLITYRLEILPLNVRYLHENLHILMLSRAIGKETISLNSLLQNRTPESEGRLKTQTVPAVLSKSFGNCKMVWCSCG